MRTSLGKVDEAALCFVLVFSLVFLQKLRKYQVCLLICCNFVYEAKMLNAEARSKAKGRRGRFPSAIVVDP